jgi:hypothetical protein
MNAKSGSSRPRKSDRNNATFAGTDRSGREDDSDLRTGAIAETGLGGINGSTCEPVAGRAWPDSSLHSRAFSSRRRSHSTVTLASCSDNVSNSCPTGHYFSARLRDTEETVRSPGQPQSAAQNSLRTLNASAAVRWRLHSAASLANGAAHSSGGGVRASGMECVARRPKVA